MKRVIFAAMLGLALACGSAETKPTQEKPQPVNADPKPAPEKPTEEKAPGAALNDKAPDFTLKDSSGQEHKLSAYLGKYVVLEWVNYGCPFVKRQYSLGAMQKTQKELTEKGVIWLAINSSAAGKQGYFEGDELKAQITAQNAAHSAYLLDTDGTVGKLYGAKTTPHMYVINPEGRLIYRGAIDDQATADESKPLGKNYVVAALEEAMAGKPVASSDTPPYGCAVKYQ